jgi:hypothetical protein
MIPLAAALVVLVALGIIPFVWRSPRWGTASRAGIGLVLLIVLVLFVIGWM